MKKRTLFFVLVLFSAISTYSQIELDSAEIFRIKKADVFIKSGQHFDSIKNYKEAISEYKKAIKVKPDYTKAHYYMGISKYNSGKYKDALKDFIYVIQIDNKYKEEAYVERAKTKSQLLDNKGALLDLDSVLVININYAEAYFEKGVLKEKEKDFPRAMENYNEAIRLKPNYTEAYLKRALGYLNVKKLNESLADLNKAISLMGDKPNGEVLYTRADVKFNKGEFKEAVGDYTKAIVLLKDVNLYIHRAAAKLNSNDFKGAIADCDTALQLKSKDPNIFNIRGTAKGELKNYKGAIEDLTKAISLKPGYTSAFINRGKFKYLSGHKEDGCSDLYNAEKMGSPVADELIRAFCKDFKQE